MNNLNSQTQIKKYFSNRNVEENYMSNYVIPPSLLSVLPKDKNAAILDIGCGFGYILNILKLSGYNNLGGIDISEEAVSVCKKNGLNVEQVTSLDDFFRNNNKKYDFILMTHVIEHIPKDKIIETLKQIKSALTENGTLYLSTPNAQSNTGSYWMFEDFTHTTIFTSGSIIYVLKSAGFDEINFVDPHDLMRHTFLAQILKKFLLSLYKLNKKFWNKVTASSYHKPSPEIYAFEIKVIAK